MHALKNLSSNNHNKNAESAVSELLSLKYLKTGFKFRRITLIFKPISLAQVYANLKTISILTMQDKLTIFKILDKQAEPNPIQQ